MFQAIVDSQLDGVRGNVLATKPLLNIQTANAMVCAEANCQDAILRVTIGEEAVMASRKMSVQRKKGSQLIVRVIPCILASKFMDIQIDIQKPMRHLSN